MVESAFEFLRICRDENYHDIVLSMKASNTQVMVQAYRLLVHRMMAQGWDYPLHLGVTEAGDGEDGRVKSAVGIGALLEDGLGDTVRVSSPKSPSGDPRGARLVDRYAARTDGTRCPFPTPRFSGEGPIDPFSACPPHCARGAQHRCAHVPVVMADLSTRRRSRPPRSSPGAIATACRWTSGTSPTRPATTPSSARTRSTSRSPERSASCRTMPPG
jgi:(E)-4-hydroxy-3-methylbut-2-enyl-diphosphate synthase